jgi:hypothetical protein
MSNLLRQFDNFTRKTVDWFLQADQYVNESINSITYTDTQKSWKVPKKITIGWETTLPLPPANYSETTKNELLYLSKLTTNRTSEQTDLVKLVDDDPGHLFRSLAKKKGLKMPEDRFDKVWALTYPIVMNLKWKFNRPRPFQLAEKYGIKLDVIDSPTINSPAYPSGHSAIAAMWAYILSEEYPEHSSLFFNEVSRAELARCLQGVHYPSDNSAAMVITGAIWENVRYNV